ncbi:MAG TPA: hypothetical protein GX529_09660 [Firmicutes bacterium]|nr:hypothetical protein [Candidatus Fermentithermobacillaceae bacterium]
MSATKRQRLARVLWVVSAVLMLIRVVDITNTRKIVNILDNYHRVDRIVISRGKAETVISGDELGRYKEAFEPGVILSGHRKAINKVLGDKYLEMRFFIEDKILFRSVVYELQEGDEAPGCFEMGNRKYMMKVGWDYRSLNETSKEFLLEAVPRG